MNAPRRTLITGGNGHVASSLARRLLAQSDEHLLLWLHADAAETFNAKRERLQADLGDTHGRVAFAGGDLRSPQPFAGIDPGTIRRIVHAAAVTRFNVEEDLAREVNELGTAKLLELASRCDRLERLALLSTVYASGLRSGDIEELPLDGGAGFANHYERSKWAAEERLLTRHAGLPWQIMRIATVIADDAESGHVSQYNAFHNTLKLLYHGLLPIIPGRQDTPLYFVTSEFVAEALLRVLLDAPCHQIYHLAHTRAQSLSLGELLARAFGCFEREPDFKRRRVMQPLYADEDSFARLATTLEGMSGELMRQSVGSVRPFAKQLFLHKNVRNERLAAQCPHLAAPDPGELVERVCAHLLRTRWGREGTGVRAELPIPA